jgi:catechol 2,3-dioxygenase-like lactoylglutathione lyase family enzyme
VRAGGPPASCPGAWLEAGTAVENASLEGEGLRLPGHDPDGPTLEIYSYSSALEKPDTVANRLGLGHLAFGVPDVEEALGQVLAEGGRPLGEFTSASVQGKGQLTFVYARDPEDNVVELQSWSV